MRFSRDRRGQSVVVGTVVLFGFLILALGIYQVQVVPTENADVEFEHSQEVEDHFGDLRNGVLDAAATASTRSTQIRLGTRYPSRTFFVNPRPSPARSRLRRPVSSVCGTRRLGAMPLTRTSVYSGTRPRHSRRDHSSMMPVTTSSAMPRVSPTSTRWSLPSSTTRSSSDRGRPSCRKTGAFH